MEIPTLAINERFYMELINDENYDECLNIFIDGHVVNPFMQSVKATREEIYNFYSYKFKVAVETRPLQQFSVRDKQNNNKIVGTLLSQHFAHTKSVQKVFKENIKKIIENTVGVKERIKYDTILESPQYCQKFLDDIEETQNPFIYQQTSIAVLPEYFKYGLFIQMMAASTYIAVKLGLRAYIDICYNHGTIHVAKKYYNGKKINEINIRDKLYNGKKVFDTKEHVVELIYSDLNTEYCKKVIANDEKYQDFYYECIQYIKKQNQKRNLNKIPLLPQKTPQEIQFLQEQQQYKQNIYPRL